MKNYYDADTKTMNYFTEEPEKLNDLFSSDRDTMNAAILKDFYKAVEWVLKKSGYDDYREIQSNTINPAQQNAFIPLREYRVKKNGHYKTVKIFHRFWGGCCVTEEAF